MPDAYTRVTTVRITEEQAVEVELVARVLGISVAELIRTAIADYLTKRKGEVKFRQRLARRIEEDRRILDRLADECNCCCGQTTARLTVCPAHPETCPDGRQHSLMDGRCRHCGTSVLPPELGNGS